MFVSIYLSVFFFRKFCVANDNHAFPIANVIIFCWSLLNLYHLTFCTHFIQYIQMFSDFTHKYYNMDYSSHIQTHTHTHTLSLSLRVNTDQNKTLEDFLLLLFGYMWCERGTELNQIHILFVLTIFTEIGHDVIKNRYTNYTGLSYRHLFMCICLSNYLLYYYS